MQEFDRTKLIPIGFWRDPQNDNTKDYPDPQSWVDKHWEARERAQVAAYLRDGRVVTTWRGYPSCRFNCWTPRKKLGSRDLSDGVYIWPEGLAHYVEKHRVRPPEHFLSHVREQLRRRVAKDQQ